MESESEDEVMIHNPPHPIPTHHNVSPVPPAADGCKEDDLTLLALAKPAMARSRQKRKAQAVREQSGTTARQIKNTTNLHPNPPAAVPAPLSISDCYNLSDEELLKIYEYKIRGITLHGPADAQNVTAAGESALQNMAHYSQMLMNVQESIISAAQALIREIETCEKIVESSRDHVSGEEMYSEEQCQAANADAAEKRQAQVEADLEQKAAEAVLAYSGDGKSHLPVAPVYARAVATGSTERDEAFQVIAHILAPDCKLVSKACAIEEAMFRLWGSSGANPDYQQRVHALLQLLCPEGLPGVFCAANKQRRVNGSQKAVGSSQHSSISQDEWSKMSRESSRVRAALWTGQANIVKLVSEL